MLMMHSCTDGHRSSRQGLPDSHLHSCSRQRRKTREESKRSRYYGRKTSRERSRSRSRDVKRHNCHRSTSDRCRHRSYSRSRSNSPYHRPNSSRRQESSQVHSAPTKNVPPNLRLITHDACYFLLKSNNFDNLLLAKAESVWSTPPHNEVRINNALKSKSNVILIFCVKESNSFQGFARVSAESNKTYPPLPWVLPVGLSAKALSSVFTLDWICRDELPFLQVRHLRNSLNMDRPVHVGRDGQEVDGAVGEAVCQRFAIDWSSADAQRALEKARLTLTLRGIDADSILRSDSLPQQH